MKLKCHECKKEMEVPDENFKIFRGFKHYPTIIIADRKYYCEGCGVEIDI